MEEQQERSNSFYFHWLSFLLGVVLGFIAVVFIFFTQTRDRKDKVYSSLLGMAIGMLVNFYLLKRYGLFPIN
jgi:hypothetical protein